MRKNLLIIAFLIACVRVLAQKDSVDLENLTIRESANVYNLLTSKVDLSVAQTLKYPGVFFDPARLAMAKAGVVNDNDQANGLSIRGNSPNSLQWRMEGAIVTNPNHLSNASSYENNAAINSGGVNMLSTQMLGTSSLVMGGFTSEYNNVLSGVMDMRLRNGSSDKRHSVAQIGLVGIDLSTEGAMSKNKRWTYLANYRYSTVGLLSKLGVSFGGEKTAFQDLATTISYTNPKNWAAKIFFIVGKSHNYFTNDTSNTEINGFRKFTNLKFDQSNIISGFTLNGKLKNEDEWKITLAQSIVSPLSERKSYPYQINDTLSVGSFYSKDSVNIKSLTSLFAQYKKKINNSLNIRLGTNLNLNYKYRHINTYYDTLTSFHFNIFADLIWQVNPKTQIVLGNLFDASKYIQGYISITPFSILYMHREQKIRELWLPRVNLLHQLNDKQTLSLSYNKSSFLNFTIYETTPTISNNINAKYQIKHSNWQSYIELFYQKINNNSNFLNNNYAVEKNVQENKGIAIGLYATQNTYFVDANFVLFDAFTKTDYILKRTNDRFSIKQNAQFNGRFALNITAGKEWQLKRQRSFGFNAHVFYNGGMSRSPQYTQYQLLSTPPLVFNNLRFPNYFRLDTRLYLSKAHKKLKSTLSLDIQNVTNNKVLTGENLDTILWMYIPRYQVGMVPILNYRMEW